jgi:CD109 antigen
LSTQDTVVGLTALSKYAELTKGAETKLKVNYDAGSGKKEVLINARNADVLQEYELPIETRAVDVHASGKGTVLAQLSWTYYVEDAVREPAFAIRVDTTQTAAKDLNLKVCTSYLKEGTSNMAIVEVNLPSGYSFDSEPLTALRDSVSNYKRHEVENQNTKLQIYLDSLSSEETCIPLVANRVFTVGKQAPAYVSVYDYYDTTETARAFYEPPQLSICDICNETNDCDANNCV